MFRENQNPKPVKLSVESVLASDPEIAAIVERKRAEAQRNWELETAQAVQDELGFSPDVCLVAARHSRIQATARERALKIADILAELAQVE